MSTNEFIERGLIEYPNAVQTLNYFVDGIKEELKNILITSAASFTEFKPQIKKINATEGTKNDLYICASLPFDLRGKYCSIFIGLWWSNKSTNAPLIYYCRCYLDNQILSLQQHDMKKYPDICTVTGDDTYLYTPHSEKTTDRIVVFKNLLLAGKDCLLEIEK